MMSLSTGNGSSEDTRIGDKIVTKSSSDRICLLEALEINHCLGKVM